MPLLLGQNEAVLWDSRAVTSIRGWILSVIFFLGVGLAGFGILGAVLAAFSFLFFLVTLILSIVSFTSLRNAHFYITNQRIVREQGTVSKKNWELPLQYLTNANFSQSFANRLRGIGNIYFGSTDRKNLTFVRVKEPPRVKQVAMEAKSKVASFSTQPAQSFTREREVITREVTLIQCRSCGARYPQGTLKCLTCGANL
jgi:uncharacterized membrane protein YdbT with pleckstrin-like domain